MPSRACCLPLLTLVFLLAASTTPVAAEYMPPPTFEDLLRADYVAVGCFVPTDGEIRGYRDAQITSRFFDASSR